MMLPKEKRIVSARDFSKVKKYGKSVASPLLLFGALKVEGLTDSKFGIIITNQVSKSSVERHRIKRLISRLIQENHTKFTTGYLYVFVARGLIEGKNYEDISASFTQAISKIPLL